MYSVDKLKKEIIKLIEETNDEELLALVKGDIVLYKNSKENDIADGLTPAHFLGLENAAKEADNKEVMSWDDFKKETNKWRKK